MQEEPLKIPSKHLKGLQESERLEAEGKLKHYTQEEFEEHMERVFARYGNTTKAI